MSEDISQDVSGAAIAKLSLPRLAGGIIRPRLFKLMDQYQSRSATWISAPAGSGKTTLAATYVLEKSLPHLWYQLDKDDSDPATFFYYLGIAARQFVKDKSIFLPLLTPEYLPDIPGFARRYFRVLSTHLPPDCTLILDNYQDAGEAQPFAEIIKCALQEVSGHVRFLILSRQQPPPVLAQGQTDLAIIEWDAVRLTLDETYDIVSQNHDLDYDIIRSLHRRADGWAAGITLLAQLLRQGRIDAEHLDADSLGPVFDFFASEFFDSLPTSTQDFLAKTSFLTHITPRIAEDLTGNKSADQILSDLHRQHFFIHRRDLEEESYQYHSLFREFLLAKAVLRLTPEGYVGFLRHAGKVLANYGYNEDAISLYLQAQLWKEVTPLLLNQAPLLVAQGRSQTVSGWLHRLPEELVRSMPWLLYWKGISKVSVQPLDAQEDLRQAFAVFEAEGVAIGKIISAAAIIDITYFLRQSLLSALSWLESIQDELSYEPHFPSPAVEGRVLTTVISMLMYMRPQDVNLPRYSQRLSALLEDLDINQQVVSGTHLVHYYTMVEGDLLACERLALNIRSMLKNPAITPLNQILWRTLSAHFTTLKFSKKEAYDTLDPLLSIVRGNSLEFLEAFVKVILLNVYEIFENTDETESLLQYLEANLNTAQPADIAWLNLAKTLVAVNRREYKLATGYGKAALALTTGVGATLIEIEIHCLLAAIYCELAEYQTSLTYLNFPKNLSFAESPRIKREALQVEAYIYLNMKRSSQCHAMLKEAFSIARQQGYFGSWLCWSQRMMSRLSAEALKEDIEPVYVRELIRKHSLPSEDPMIDIWPWPVKIYTLGGFRLLIDEQPLAMNKGQQKPLLLLQAVIALGGEDVKLDRVSEILWPDTEGDAAISAFTTALGRLRKIIGEDTVHVSGGRVSLNRRRCWVDALALDYYLDNVKAIDPDSSPVEFLNKIAGLYRGPFIRGESEGWAQPFRNKLRKKITREVHRQLEAADEEGAEGLHRLLHELKNADGEIHI